MVAVAASFGGGRVAGGRHCSTVAVAASKKLGCGIVGESQYFLTDLVSCYLICSMNYLHSLLTFIDISHHYHSVFYYCVQYRHEDKMKYWYQ